ncbi:MAG TPA: RIP metalloprotease RseP [Rhodocyclaceae bacterium]|nr:RIP metalloprotease RseP [Rhodocyclaceae bacterium]
MPPFFSTLFAFLIALAGLIIVHEFGHFLVARLCGVRVLRFSIGFGKSIWRKRIGSDRTELSIGLLPLGGYVKMLDEREAPVNPKEVHRAFNRQTLAKRSAIVVAGPAANFLFAILIYWGVFLNGTQELFPILGAPPDNSPAAVAGILEGQQVKAVDDVAVATWDELRWALLRKAAAQDEAQLTLTNEKDEIAFHTLSLQAIKENGWQGEGLSRLGLEFYRPKIPALIGAVVPASAGERAGLRPGDLILTINGREVVSWRQVVELVRESAGKPLAVTVERMGEVFSYEIRPEQVIDRGQSVWRIGVSVAEPKEGARPLRGVVSYGFVEAGARALRETWEKSIFSLVMFGKMLTGEVSWRNLSGPVTIADYAGQSARLGMDYYLKFVALVSISLGVLNLLPVPVLDGGHLLYHTIEFIKRGPLSERFIMVTQQVGMFLLLVLMSFAFYNDILRLVSG